MEYFEAKATLDAIAQRIKSNVEAITKGRSIINSVVNDLAAMQTDYATLVSEIDAAVAVDPLDRAWLLAQSERNKLVAEFQSHKNTAQALKAAMDAV